MPPYSVERHLSLRRVGSMAVAPDGTWLAVEVQRLDTTGARYVTDLWRVSLTGAGSPRRLTFGEVSSSVPRFRPDGSLGFLSRRAVPEEKGDPVTQVWLLPEGGGEATPLTSEPLGVLAFRFGGDTLAVLANVWPDVPLGEAKQRWQDRAKDGPSVLRYHGVRARHWDAWLGPTQARLVVSAADGSGRRDLSGNLGQDLLEACWALSPDGASVVIAVRRPGRDQVDDGELRVFDVATGEHRVLAARPGEDIADVVFFPGGDHVAVLFEERPVGRAPRPDLRVIDVRDGAMGSVVELGPACPTSVICAADGSALYLACATSGRGAVWRLDLQTDRFEQVTVRGSFDHLVPLPGGDGIVGAYHEIVHPPEPAVLRPGGTPTRLANLSGWDPAEAGARVEELSARAADGAQVHGFVVVPESAAGPSAALLWIHGGPIGAHSDGWHWRWSPLLAAGQGYVVGLPNPRGSTGYGQAFVDGIWNNRYGLDCYTDLLAWTDALEGHPSVDREKIAAMGGSFGGYMTNWMAGQTDRFQCYVTHAGLWHFDAFLATDYPSWWRLQLGGDTDPAVFHQFSPHRFASKWTRPALLLHGERDYRVPVSEALLAYEALQHHGVDVELVIFPDENHWIAKPRNVSEWYGAVFGFLARHLG